ncbi:DUF2339 domain-containing protein [Patulibacter minatonensis]|uniref:DUF2339 domain-containing protein n=1 Tax=Patulibacter minatonensis TaxID=298163 RepID=UPI000479656C|nr:DUF2339 domain-containing protein [Patulibacter minatonensis]
MSRTATPEAPSVPPDVIADLQRRLSRVEAYVGVPTAGSQPRRPAPEPRPEPRPVARPTVVERVDGPLVAPRPVEAPPAPVRVRLDEALVGGRLLAWAGGAALLFALGTLFWLGVRDGWLSEPLRCLLGAAASVGLLAAGLRNARNGVAREASWAMAGTGLAGLYATVAVSTATYELVPTLLGLPALAALGVASAALALRWDAPPLAGIGLLGALAAPIIAPVDGLVLPVVVLAMAATGLLLRHRPWTWLAAAATALALPQIAWHVVVLLDDLQSTDPSSGTLVAPGVAILATLGAGLAMVAGWELRNPEARERWTMPLLLVVHAGAAAALAGGYALVDRPAAAVVTLVLAAGLLAGSALRVRRSARTATPVELVLLSTSVLILDLGFAIAASGLLQLLGWAVTAVGFALLARHAARQQMPVLIGGLGLHAGLALIETAGAYGQGPDSFVVACAVLAAVCGVSARVIAPRSEDARMILDLSALAVAFVWTAVTLDGVDLSLVLAAQAAGLLLLDRRAPDLVARGAGLAVLAISAAIALLHDEGAPAQATWDVVPAGTVGDLVLPILAVAAAAAVGAFALRGAHTLVLHAFDADAGGPGDANTDERDAATDTDADEETGPRPLGPGLRTTLVATAGGALLLASSILAGHVAGALGGGADASAVARDVLWATTGLGLLAAGLVRAEAPVRMVGLSFLAGIGVKIALIDLADVDTAGRVVAWAVLGALLLVGAGLYARLKPTSSEDVGDHGPSVDDLRSAGASADVARFSDRTGSIR